MAHLDLFMHEMVVDDDISIKIVFSVRQDNLRPCPSE